MQRHGLHRTERIVLFISLLLLLAACGSKVVPQQATTTPTPAITPIPTLPNIPGVPVHFSTQDHLQLAGVLYGTGGTTAIICSHEHPGSKAQWDDSAPWFAARGFMVLA